MICVDTEPSSPTHNDNTTTLQVQVLAMNATSSTVNVSRPPPMMADGGTRVHVKKSVASCAASASVRLCSAIEVCKSALKISV
jgi:hypothetical protein